jgi:hypothetical protein
MFAGRAGALLLAVFLFGVARVAALPPFEGYDEVAHWSSIQQIADDGQIPVYGRDHLSVDVARKRTHGRTGRKFAQKDDCLATKPLYCGSRRWWEN